MSEIRLPGLYRRRPVAATPRAVAAFLDIGDAAGLDRLALAGEKALQPVEYVLVGVRAAKVRQPPQRVILALEHPHFLWHLEIAEGFDRVFQWAQRIEL